MTRQYATIRLLDKEDLKEVKIVSTAALGTLYGVDEDMMDTPATPVTALLLEFTDGSSQLVAVPPEVQDQMLRYLCTEDTATTDQADKLYRGYLHLKEALTR